MATFCWSFYNFLLGKLSLYYYYYLYCMLVGIAFQVLDVRGKTLDVDVWFDKKNKQKTQKKSITGQLVFHSTVSKRPA